MMILAKLIILTVIIVLALRVALSEGMLLEKVGVYFENKVKEGYRIFDVFICPWCAGTLQSLTAHAFAFGLGVLPFEFSWQLIIRWPLVVFGSSFISGFLWTLYLSLNAKTEYYKSVTYHNEEEKQFNSER